jgi:hypothetical protein
LYVTYLISRELYELQHELGQERAAAEALSAERDTAAGRAGDSERLVQGLVGAQAEGLRAQGALEAQVGGGWGAALKPTKGRADASRPDTSTATPAMIKRLSRCTSRRPVVCVDPSGGWLGASENAFSMTCPLGFDSLRPSRGVGRPRS